MRNLRLAAVWALPAVALAVGTVEAAAPAGGASAPAPSVAASTGTADLSTVEQLYQGSKLRDPFLPADLAPAGGGPAESPLGLVMPMEEFSIHGLLLRGIMQDRGGAFAVLSEPKYGTLFVLKKGRLFDAKNKPVPGVTGSIKMKQKMVSLMTPDKDVQVLILGETDEEEEARP